MTDYLVNQIADIREDVSALKGARVTYRDAEVVAVDVLASTFTADVPGAGHLQGISSPPQFLPAVGDVVRLTLNGAVPAYQPHRIGEGAVGETELAPEVVQTIQTTVDTANGKNSATFSEFDASPATPGTKAGDIWWKIDPATHVVLAGWQWDGDSWEPRTFGDGVLDALDVGKLVTGTLAAGVSITIGNSASDHTVIDGTDGLSFLVDDPTDGVPNLISRFGRDAGGFDPATGLQTWAIPSDGRASLHGLSVTEDPLIQGQPLSVLLDNSGAGRLVAFGQVNFPGFSGVGLGRLGIMEVAANLRTDRSYRVYVQGLNILGTVTLDDVEIDLRTSGGPGQPDVNNAVAAGPFYSNIPGAGRYRHHDWSSFLSVPYTGLHRFLLTVRRGDGGSGSLNVNNCQPILAIYDTGPHVLNVGVLNTGGAPTGAAPVQRNEILTDALWSATYNGGGGLDSEPEIIQGYTSSYTPRGNAKSLIGFPDVTALLAGVTDDRIERIELSLYASHWYYTSGGHGLFGYHNNASRPGSWPVTASTGQWSWNNWGRNQRITMDITNLSGLKAALRTGNVRGFTVGPGTTTDPIYYGRFNGAGMAEPPRLHIVYYK